MRRWRSPLRSCDAELPSERELRDLVDYRAIVEGGAAELAARRATTAQLEHLAELTAEMAAIADFRRWSEQDTLLHLVIADAAGPARLMVEVGRVRAEVFRISQLVPAIAAQLWLPLVLIEISWRNLVDRILIDKHPAAEWWFIDAPPAPGSETFGADSLIAGPQWLQPRLDDPILAAARAFQRHVRASQMRRDDMVAHLTFGFWALGVPARARARHPDRYLPGCRPET